MLEHMPIFLSLFWGHAIFFVSIKEATILGSCLHQLLVPFIHLLWGKNIGRDIPKRILVVTFSNYFITIYFMVSIDKSIGELV